MGKRKGKFIGEGIEERGGKGKVERRGKNGGREWDGDRKAERGRLRKGKRKIG